MQNGCWGCTSDAGGDVGEMLEGMGGVGRDAGGILEMQEGVLETGGKWEVMREEDTGHFWGLQEAMQAGMHLSSCGRVNAPCSSSLGFPSSCFRSGRFVWRQGNSYTQLQPVQATFPSPGISRDAPPSRCLPGNASGPPLPKNTTQSTFLSGAAYV